MKKSHGKRRIAALILGMALIVAQAVTAFADGPGGAPGGPPGQSVSVTAGTPYSLQDETLVYDSGVPHVVINKVYGASDDGYASHSYIELYNPTDSAVDLSSWSIQYQSSQDGEQNGTWQKLNLTGTIEAGGTYLIRCAAVTDTSNVLYQIPAGQQQWDIQLHNKGISVVLMYNQTQLWAESLSGNVFEDGKELPEGYVDLLGEAGNDVAEKTEQIPPAYEGSYGCEQSKKKALTRTSGADTDSNEADYSVLNYAEAGNDVPSGYTPDEAITDVVLNVGADETQLGVTWYATTNSECILQITESSNVSGGEFPTDASKYTEYTATADTTNKSGYYSQKVTVKNLKQGCTYVYRVSGADGVWSDCHTYECQASGSNHAFSFVAVGDPQIGASNTASDTSGWISTISTALERCSNASFILGVGDQINRTSSYTSLEAEYSGFLSASGLTSLPFVATVGNHEAENEASYTYHFLNPNLSTYGSTDSSVTGEEDYYFTYNNVLFMVLNTNNSSVAEHQAFMKDAMQENSDCTWNIVVFHQSLYSVARHVSDVSTLREALSPVLAELDIDVAIMGHDHVYARSYIMGGENGMEAEVTEEVQTEITDPDGVQYVTLNSASGSKFYDITEGAFEYTAVSNQSNVPNYSTVTIDDDSFTMTTYQASDNAVVDTFTITKTTKTNSSQGENGADTENGSDDNAGDSSTENNGQNSTLQETAVVMAEEQIAATVDIIYNAADTTTQLTIDMGDATVIDHSILAAAKATGKDLILKMGKNKTAYQWRIKADSITSATDIDLEVIFDENDIPTEKITEVANGAPVKLLSLVYDGEFGFDAYLTVSLDAGYAGSYGNLFYYNETSGQLEFMNSAMIESDGSVTLAFSHASDYVIVIGDNMASVTSPTTGDEGSSTDVVICLIILLLCAGVAVKKYGKIAIR